MRDHQPSSAVPIVSMRLRRSEAASAVAKPCSSTIERMPGTVDARCEMSRK